MSSGNSILLFVVFFLLLETMIEIKGNKFYKKNIFLLVETFSFFLPEEAVFLYNGNVFSTNASFRLVETYFERLLHSSYWRRVFSLVKTDYFT